MHSSTRLPSRTLAQIRSSSAGRWLLGITVILLAFCGLPMPAAHAAYPTNGWTYWDDLGRAPSGRAFSNISAVSRGWGGFDIFARDGEILYHRQRGGPYPTGWQSLGAVPPLTGTSEIAVTSWGPGRMDLFASGTDGRIYHQSYAGSPQGYMAPYNPAYWQRGWDSISGPCPFVGYCYLSSPSVASMGDGNLQVVVRTSAGVYHIIYDGRWSPWVPLGLPPSGSRYDGTPTITGTGGHLELFLTAANGGIYRRQYNGQGWFDSIGGVASRWNGWSDIGTPAGFQMDAVAASGGIGNRHVYVFANDPAAVHYRSVGSVEPSWWFHLFLNWSGGTMGDPALTVAMHNGVFQIGLFQNGGDGNLHEIVYEQCPPPEHILNQGTNLFCVNA